MTASDVQSFISLGGVGILAYIMYRFSERFVAALEKQYDARIATLEKAIRGVRARPREAPRKD